MNKKGKTHKPRFRGRRRATNPKKKDMQDDFESDEGHEENLDYVEGTEYDEDEREVVSKWYDEFGHEKLEHAECTEEEVMRLRTEAEKVLEDEIKEYKSQLYKSKRRSDAAWMGKVVKSGTSTDKVAALTVMVQESPIHNVSALSSLVNMVKVSKKQQFILVIETLAELFVSDLLKPGKKLKKFNRQPLAHLSNLSEGDNRLRRKRLCYWLFEDQLKDLYAQFVNCLNIASHDSVHTNRAKAVAIMSKLLMENPEQEKELITNTVNKLGDPEHKVASKVVYCLDKVLCRCPSMKQNILTEIEKLLFRPRIGQRAQYYGICFLSRYRFTHSDSKLARDMIILYFSFFKACVKTGNIDSRLMGSLLVGVNRAYPFASRSTRSKGDSVIPEEYINTIYKIVHMAPFKISLQALALLLQISNSDRFYNALYKKLLDEELRNTSHQGIWLNLVHKALMKDKNINRIRSFVKRLLQMCQYFAVPLACGTLVMLSHLSKRCAGIFDNDVFMEMEKPEGADVNAEQAGVKIENNNDDDEDDEKYYDVKLEDEEESGGEHLKEVKKRKVPSSWLHRNLMMPKMEPEEKPEDLEVKKEKVFQPVTKYDGTHRNPAFAGGEYAVFSELLNLTRHFHPSVALFSKTMLNKLYINYTGDPLRDFTLIRFLERFSFKNPKRQRQLEEEGEKKELFRSVGTQRKHYVPKGLKALPVESEDYLKQPEHAIPVDELFLYKYLNEKRAKSAKLKNKKKRKKDESDDESVGSVEFNEYLDTLLGADKSNRLELDFAEDVGITKERNKNKKQTKRGKDGLEDEHEEGDGEDLFTDEEKDDFEEEKDDFSDDDEQEEEEEDEEEFEEMGSDAENNNSFIDDDLTMSGSEDLEDGSDRMSYNEEDISEFEYDSEDEKLPLVDAVKKKVREEFGNLAVSAEKFSEMLEDVGRKKTGGHHDFLNPDNAGEKQIKWEASKMKQHWHRKKKKKLQSNRNNAGKNNRKRKKFKV